jgi:hypothetical protein
MDSAIVHFSIGIFAGLLGVGAIILNFYAIWNITKEKCNEGAAWGCWAGEFVIWLISLWAMSEVPAVLQVFTVFVILTLIYISVASCGGKNGGSCCGSCCGGKKKKSHHSHHGGSSGGHRRRNSSCSEDGRPGVGYSKRHFSSSASSSSSC